MKSEVLNILCSPVKHEHLQIISNTSTTARTNEVLVSDSNEKYPVYDGIPVFLDASDLTGFNKRYEKIYTLAAPFFDVLTKLFFSLKGKKEEIRMEYLKELEIRDGSRVLEISVGTGGNLQFLPKTAQCFGLDISFGMLKQCKKNLKKRSIDASICCGNAEKLPYKDKSFDVVFHMGGINYFNDKAKAIKEMIRVAKPGAKILIADENEKVVKSSQKVPFAKDILKNEGVDVSAPMDLIPVGVSEVQLKNVWDGDLYCLTFRVNES